MFFKRQSILFYCRSPGRYEVHSASTAPVTGQGLGWGSEPRPPRDPPSARLEKSKADGKTERNLYAKYKCYCDTNTEEKTGEIKTLTEQIDILESKIEELQSSTGSLSEEVAKLKAAMEANQASQDDAAGSVFRRSQRQGRGAPAPPLPSEDKQGSTVAGVCSTSRTNGARSAVGLRLSILNTVLGSTWAALSIQKACVISHFLLFRSFMWENKSSSYDRFCQNIPRTPLTLEQ